LKRVALLALIALSAATWSAAPAGAESKVVDSYCSPTGDFCQGIYREDGRLRARLTTFSFTGKIQLCLRGTDSSSSRDCKKFVLRDNEDLFLSSVALAKHFDISAPGRYAVSWRYRGTRIGETLHFNKG